MQLACLLQCHIPNQLTPSLTFAASQPLLCTAAVVTLALSQTCHCGCFSQVANFITLLQICGEANVGVIREAARAGVPRCAFISVHDYNFPGTAYRHRWLVCVQACPAHNVPPC